MGLINQAPTEEESKSTEEPNPYMRRIKTVQFIDIFKKVGLINQTPTKYKRVLINQAPTEESIHKKDQNRSVYLYIQKGGLDESSPYRRIYT